MKSFVYILPFLLSTHLLAQTNYVADAANSPTPGNNNTLIGPQAGNKITSGCANSFIGYQAGYNNTVGNANSFIGFYAGVHNTTGNSNSFVGATAGLYNTTGGYNSFMGSGAGFYNGTGSYNSFVGSNVGSFNTTGYNNSFLGAYAGFYNDTGYSNIAIGTGSFFTNVNGHGNVMIGDSSGYVSTVSGNTFIGSKAGFRTKTGSQNTFVGYQAGATVTTGSNNIIIGPNAGTAVVGGNENVLMGYNSQAKDGLHNATAIGAGSRVAISDALILGNQANVGIGTSAPTTRLEVVSDKPDDSGLRLTNLTTDSPAAHSTDQFLTVNQQGEVVKARYQLRIGNVNEWSDKVFSPAYRLQSLSSVASYVSQHGHLPGVPSAQEVVQAGVGLVKMNATLLEKVEELTLYSIQQDKALQQQQKEINELKQLVNQLIRKK